MPSTTLTVAALAVLGVALLLRGEALFRIALPLGGFLAGAGLVASLHRHLPREPAWLAPLLVLSAGLLGAMAIRILHRAALFGFGAFVAVAGLLAVPEILPRAPEMRLLALAVAGLVGGLLMRVLERLALILATSLLGAIVIGSALERFGIGWARGWIAILVLALIGVAMQLARGKAEKVDSSPG